MMHCNSTHTCPHLCMAPGQYNSNSFCYCKSDSQLGNPDMFRHRYRFLVDKMQHKNHCSVTMGFYNWGKQLEWNMLDMRLCSHCKFQSSISILICRINSLLYLALYNFSNLGRTFCTCFLICKIPLNNFNYSWTSMNSWDTPQDNLYKSHCPSYHPKNCLLGILHSLWLTSHKIHILCGTACRDPSYQTC